MDYNVMDYVSNGIIVSDIEKSEILYVNKVAKELLKITDEHQVKSISQFISTAEAYENLRLHLQDDTQKHGKSEGIMYLKTLDGTFIEVRFICVAKEDNPNIVHYIFNKAVEVIDEKQISFKELTNNTPQGIVIEDIKNELFITFLNAENADILKVKSEENIPLKNLIFIEDINWVIAEIYMNLKNNLDINMEFRIKSSNTENTKVKWVYLYGKIVQLNSGKKALYGNLTDLSKRKYIDDKLHLERVMFHKIVEISDDRIFRIDLKTDVLHLLGSKDNSVIEIAVFENYRETLLSKNKIHTEDVNVYKDLINHFQIGVEKNFEIRYLVDSKEFEWHKIKYSFVRNSYGEPILVIGKLTNINTQKNLEEQAKTDLLTKFYNKITTEQEAKHIMDKYKDGKHAFFIVDIDNFKAINDNLGHHFGDIVLRNIANDIRNCFRTKDILGRICGKIVDVIDNDTEISVRQKDILGRIGGDEFIIIMRDVQDENVVLEKARVICSILDKTFTNSDNTKSYSISASVGISMYPKHGTTYEELYKKSDIALYDIKKTEKNGYKIYSDEISEKQGKHDIVAINNNYKGININTMNVSSVLDILYETKDLNTSITSILMYLGNMYNVDRCYLFEATENVNSYENRYKWARYGKEDKLESGINNKNLKNILAETDANGVFYTNEIYNIKDKVIVDRLEQEKVKSIFLVESLKEDTEHIILGLEDCTTKKEWTEKEIVTLLHIGRLMFTVINHDNTIKRLGEKNV